MCKCCSVQMGVQINRLYYDLTGECGSCGCSTQEEDQQICAHELAFDEWQGGWSGSKPRYRPTHVLDLDDLL